MERIQLFPHTRGTNTALRLKLLAGLIILIGGVNLLLAATGSASVLFSGSFWGAAANIVTGAAVYYFARTLSRDRLGFIEWDDKAVRYQTPEMAAAEEILYSEMKEIVVGLTEVGIGLNSGREKHLKLDSLEYRKLKRIKDRFEEIKLRVEGMNVN